MRRFCVVILICLLAALIVLPASAQSIDASAQDAAIRKAIDAWWSEHSLEIKKVESQYYNQTRQFWQGITTHSEPADYTAKLDTGKQITDADVFAAQLTAPDLSKVATDQPQSDTWSALLPDVVTKLPATMQIDVYDGPSGPGYSITLSYCVDQQCSKRIENIGPEEWRSYDWLVITPDESVIK